MWLRLLFGCGGWLSLWVDEHPRCPFGACWRPSGGGGSNSRATDENTRQTKRKREKQSNVTAPRHATEIATVARMCAAFESRWRNAGAAMNAPGVPSS
ncbi:hypothetical protein RSSM_03501 [Rhodopirellula sallentina SM41]|uniref:Uncharacterized protein n=1 Tax=Rhodopirellula sallentina SM41 TaxID=1263870 RepID=M5UB36_9BACT|nr:hypothetical protein RSSM_03501 [Rhodopirellula sallentina SM41]